MSAISELLINNKHNKIFQTAGKIAEKMNISIYLVGGYIRDLILNKKLSDIDIMVSDKVFEFSKLLSKELNVSTTVNFEDFLTF